MENGIIVNGQFKPIEGTAKFYAALHEVKEQLASGRQPQDIEVWWVDEHDLYHDMTCVDGKWWHNFEIKTMKHIELPI